jgi:Flp pilus assembly protein TadG
MNKFSNRNTRQQRGAVAIEFAILLIPLLTILTGITEFGRAMYYYNTLAKVARDAARLMSTQTPADPDYPALVTASRCTAVYGNADCTGQPLVPGLTLAMVSICDPSSCPSTHAAVPTGSGAANLVTIIIGGANAPYTFQTLSPFVPALFGVPSFNFAAIQVTMRQII